MKAIETVYKGYKFRSRLEARWAVFFDTLGIEYQYEKDGYDLDGVWYLPDFWLPEQDCWIEIKGKKPTEEERNKASLLSLKAYRRVFIFFGDVWAPTPSTHNSGLAFLPDDLPMVWERHYWCECPGCKKLDITLIGSCKYLPCKCLSLFAEYLQTVEGRKPDMNYRNHESLRLMEAYTAARQARFGH